MSAGVDGAHFPLHWASGVPRVSADRAILPLQRRRSKCHAAFTAADCASVRCPPKAVSGIISPTVDLNRLAVACNGISIPGRNHLSEGATTLPDPEAVRERLRQFIRGGIEAAGRQCAVLGLSGGIDSAVVCFLAAEALGPERVLVVTMPYATSAPESLQDALAVVDATGVRHQHFEITGILEPLFDRFAINDRRRRGNAMARARMMVLYDQSEAVGGLVLGTGNKTEILLGYSTVYGDSACALAPIGDLYKGQVRQLARELGVPSRIIQKAPSADLWPGQTDESDLGLTYDEADVILQQLFEGGLSPSQVAAGGHSPAKVERVCDLFRRSQFKRRLPPVARISSCTVGYEIVPGVIPPGW